ncbi:hypothetical protein [Streptomyces griseoaurantiacus]|uniref:hypothetical protein n=1 Tax=Streptomyces griseoaurantiacus TaxID=68213 RepID=UPI003813F197
MQLEQQAGRLWGGGVAARIDARITADPGHAETESAPVFHLSRHDPAPAPGPDDTLLTMFLTAVDTGTPEDRSRSAAFERWARTSPAVAASVREHEAPELVVDRLMSNLVVVNTAGALIDTQTCRVGLRSTFERLDNPDGVLLTMTSETPDAPVELFPSLLYAWLSWWRQRDRARHAPQTPPPPRRDSADINDFAGEVAAWIERAAEVNRSHPAPKINVPLPPERLELIEDGHRYTVHLHDFELTTWPDLPPAPDRGL